MHQRTRPARFTAALLLACAATALAVALAAGHASGTRARAQTAAAVPAAAGEPAPQLQGAAPLLASGPGGRIALTHWTVREDHADRGLSRGWQRGGFTGRPVSVPDTLRAGSWTGRAGEANFSGSVAWYRTSLQAPAAGEYAVSFQSASFAASTWIDGHALGSHRGAYLPFEIRAHLAAGAHTIVVRVDWRDPSRQSREGFHRTWFNWGGINGPVEARAIGPSELAQPQLASTVGASGTTVRVSALLTNHGPERTLTPQGALQREGQDVPLAFAPVTLSPGASARIVATAAVPEAALWSPAHPRLYTLRLSVAGESSYEARVGLRQITRRGDRLYLNGQRLLLHGATVQEDVSGHGDGLTSADQDALVGELRAIGANAARAQHPLDAALLERLDAAGILVWQGVGPVEGAGNWYSTTPALLAASEQQARTAVIAEQLHPSVFAWNLVDEVAGNGRDSAEVQYVRTLARWLHVHDPERLVAVDVWGDHPPAVAGPLYAEADAVAETDYSGWYDYPRDSPSQLTAAMRARLAAMERTFPGRVLAVSEFGAESNALNPSGAPGSFGYQSRLLAAHIAVYRADPHLTAMLVWVLRDYPLTPTFQGGSIHNVLPHVRLIEGLNQKGLFTYRGSPKPAAGTVASLFKSLPSG